MNKRIRNLRIFFSLLIIVVLLMLGFYLLFTAQEDQSVSDSSAADNNCCADEACSNYNGDFEAGYYACERGECSKCTGGASGSCDKDLKCEAGENHNNCSSDCDDKGFSQLAEGAVCDPFSSTKGVDQCNTSAGVRCTVCPSSKVAVGTTGFCSKDFTDSTITFNAANNAFAYKGSDAFVSKYCTPPDSLPSGDCKPIDIDKDGKLTIVDLAEFAKAYGKTCKIATGTNYGLCGATDVTKDGKVDVVDLASFALFYNKDSCKLIGLEPLPDQSDEALKQQDRENSANSLNSNTNEWK